MATRNIKVPDSVQAHIVATPGVAHGRPRIAGHRIRVQDVAVWYESMGMTPDEMADQFGLTLGEVHAALAYYFDHQQEIQRDLERDRKLIANHKRRTPSLVQAKLNKERG
jgi:uncharacterized protein (DUF433 family)